jgi:hypothetical protein
MRSGSTLAVLGLWGTTMVLVVAFACGGGGPGMDETGGSTATGGTGTGESGTGGSGTGEGTGDVESTTGPDLRPCPERLDEEDCAAGDCLWTHAYWVALTAQGCAFGGSRPLCIGSVPYDDGCGPDPWGCDMGQPSILWRETADGFELMEYVVACSHAVTDGFQTCDLGDESSTTGDPADAMPPECECACDPSWPG